MKTTSRPTTHPEAIGGWRGLVKSLFARAFAAKPTLNVWQWADAFRYLDEYSAGGRQRWKTDFTPYLREILEVLSDPRVHMVVVMKSAQVGFTQGVLMNLFGYLVHQRPCPILWVRPSDQDAKGFSKKKLEPVIRATPVLKKLIRDAPRDSGRAKTDTILSKFFDGGFVQLTGAVSPTGMRSDSVRVVMLDEVDAMDPAGSGGEGDQIDLAKKRTETFWDWLVLLGSTPVLKGFSRTDANFQRSDQRHYHVQCPHCGEWQKLEWGGRDTPFGVKWEHTVEDGQRRLVAGSVYYLCRAAACVIREGEKFSMVARGKWVAERPGASIVGFHINALISPFPGAGWEKLVAEWLAAQGDTVKLQVFFNTVLGLPWEVPGERVEAEVLLGRVEEYRAEVPRGAGLLTAAVDVQGSWNQYKVKGWGKDQESWLIETGIIPGEFGDAHVRAKLEELRNREWQHEDGATLRIQVMCIDTGGHHAEEVARYVKPRESQGVRAIRGASKPGKPIWNNPRKEGKYGVKVYSIGTENAKDMIYANLRVGGDGSAGGPRVMHWPDTLDIQYFRGLTSETAMNVKGVRRYVNPKGARNEPLDLEAYCLAGLVSLGRGVLRRLGEYATALQVEGARIRAAAAAGVASAAAPAASTPAANAASARKPRGRKVRARRE